MAALSSCQYITTECWNGHVFLTLYTRELELIVTPPLQSFCGFGGQRHRPVAESQFPIMDVPSAHSGVIQPMEEIGALCRENKVFFHTDAAQAVGKIPMDVNKMKIDLMSISGHKIYGPKGIGALVVLQVLDT